MSVLTLSLIRLRNMTRKMSENALHVHVPQLLVEKYLLFRSAQSQTSHLEELLVLTSTGGTGYSKHRNTEIPRAIRFGSII